MCRKRREPTKKRTYSIPCSVADKYEQLRIRCFISTRTLLLGVFEGLAASRDDHVFMQRVQSIIAAATDTTRRQSEDEPSVTPDSDLTPREVRLLETFRRFSAADKAGCVDMVETFYRRCCEADYQAARAAEVAALAASSLRLVREPA